MSLPIAVQRLLRFATLALLVCLAAMQSQLAAADTESTNAEGDAGSNSRPPNVVIIFIDDMGYADINPFGAKGYRTPNLNRMAAEGRRFTDFVVSSAVCSASRSALLTGCYHRRVGISGALGPDSQIGLSPEETTIAEVCKSKGYATACFGKWHLGHHPKFLPTNQGFDQFVGIPYSNDMWPRHPAVLAAKERNPNAKSKYPPLPLIDGTEVVDNDLGPDDQAEFTKEFTSHAVEFIQRNADRPFFLYLPHPMVHVPLYASAEFRGQSGAGLFGDVVTEVDWSVGQILSTIKEIGAEENTLVIFTSDNGPWLSYGDHAGQAIPLREGKGTMFEGGYREPTIMWWRGKIPAGTECDKLCSTIDILPTVAKLIGAKLPERKIDGKDISELLFGDGSSPSPHDYFYCYYGGGQLQAIRNERFKLMFPHTYRTLKGHPGGVGGLPVAYSSAQIGPALFDLDQDVAEQHDVLADYPDVAKELRQAAAQAREELGDKLTDQKGSEIRPAGRLDASATRLEW